MPKPAIIAYPATGHGTAIAARVAQTDGSTDAEVRTNPRQLVPTSGGRT